MLNKLVQVPPFPEDILSLEKLDTNNKKNDELIAQRITLQVTTHILNLVSERESYNNKFLPILLSDLLGNLHTLLSFQDKHPLPNDEIFNILNFLLKACEKILTNPKKKIIRQHEMLPVHKAKDLSTKSMNWIGKLPGRNIKEKLSRNPKILTQKSIFSVDTKENRVFVRVLKDLSKYIGARLDFCMKTDLYNFGKEDNEIYKKMIRFNNLSTSVFKNTELNDLKPALQPETNNVLINDRNYAVIWKGWQYLSKYKQQLELSWINSHRRFIQVVYWSLISKLYSHKDIEMIDNLNFVNDEDGKITLKYLRDNDYRELNQITFIYNDRKKLLCGKMGIIRNPNGSESGVITYKNQKFFFDTNKITDKPIANNNKDIVYFTLKHNNRAKISEVFYNAPECKYYKLTVKTLDNNIIFYISELRNINNKFYVTNEFSFEYSFYFSNTYQSLRGNPFSMIDQQDGSQLSDYSDFGGIGKIISTIFQKLFLATRSEDHEPLTKGKQFSETKEDIGLDFSSFCPIIISNQNKKIQTSRDYYTVSFSVDGNETLKQAKINHTYSFNNQYQHLSNLLSLDESTCTSLESYHQIISNLSREILVKQDNYLSYSVPDIIDEFSQRKIKSIFQVYFKKSMPVWRSIMGALVLHDCGHEFKMGDVIIVIDTHSPILYSTIIKAKESKKLNGIIFEHFSPLPYEKKDNELTFKFLQETYMREYFKKNKIDFERVNFNSLLQSGIIEKVITLHKKYILTLDDENFFNIEFDKNIWQDTVLNSWYKKIKRYLFRFIEDEIYKESIKKTKKGNLTVLFLSDFAQKSEITRIADIVFMSSNCRILNAKETIRGTSIISGRLKHKLPTWEEYLPDLSLEVVKDGHFAEIELIKGTSLEQSIGMEKEFVIKETLTIPANQKIIKFPLISGLTNGNPINFEAVVEDKSFPLKIDTDVKLSIKYRYGFENSYELLLTPVSCSNKPFTHIEAKWTDDGYGRASENFYPEFPEFTPDNSSLTEDIEILYDLLQRLTKIFTRNIAPLSYNDDDIDYLSTQLTYNKNRLRRTLLFFNHSEVSQFMQVFFESDFIRYLGNTIGLTRGYIPDAFFNDLGNKNIEKLRNSTTLFLASMGAYAPASLYNFLINKDSSIEVLNRLFYLREEDDLLVNRLDFYSVSLNLWFNKNLIFHIFEKKPELVESFLIKIEKSYKVLLSELTEIARNKVKIVKDWMLTDRFRDDSELLLSILRLRACKNSYNIEIGSRRTKNIAKYVRKIDSMLYRLRLMKEQEQQSTSFTVDDLKKQIKNLKRENKNYTKEKELLQELEVTWKIHSRIQFNVNKPDSLRNMTDLAFVLNAYLTGDTGKSRIQIIGVLEDR